MRQEQIIHGIHAVQASLEYDRDHLMEVYRDKERTDRRLEALLLELKQAGVEIHKASRRELDKLAGGERHQGIVARVLVPPTLGEKELMQLLDALDGPPLLLVLDGVTDPHNLGACLRTADAVGVQAVITPKDNSVGLTATARKVSSGAAETVPFVQVTNLSRTLEQLKEAEFWTVGLDGEGKDSMDTLEWPARAVLVLGAEGKGLRRLTRENCDFLVRIPMTPAMESLNLSNAAAIALYESYRQRAVNKKK